MNPAMIDFGHEAALFAYRSGEILLNAGPTLLSGTVLAGLVMAVVPGAWTRDLLGENRGPLAQALRGAFAGIVAPVCALGVIPLAWALHRRGVPRPALAALLVMAGVANPWSVVYGASMMGPWKLALILAAALIAAVVAAVVVGRSAQSSADQTAIPGSLRGAAVAAGVSVRSGLLFVVIGVAAAAVASMLTPAGFINEYLIERSPWQVAVMSGLALPAYTAPENAMMNAGHIAGFNAEPGTALAYLLLGAGLNLGTILLAVSLLGLRRALAWLATLLVLTLAFGVALSPVLRTGPIADDDSHGFDNHARPYHLATGQSESESSAAQAWAGATHRLTRLATGRPLLPLSLAATATLLAVGLSSPIVRARLAGTATPADLGARPLRPGTVRIALGAGTAAWAVLGLYVYYPAPAATLSEMRQIDALLSVAVRQREADDVARHLQDLERLADRLSPGRTIRFSSTGRAEMDTLRSRLTQLRQHVTASDWDTAQPASMDFARALRDAGRAVRNPG